MSTTKDRIRGWLQQATAEGATHVIIVCDTFNFEDYPVSVMPGQDVGKVFEEHNGGHMERVMEVYDLAKDIEVQLN